MSRSASDLPIRVCLACKWCEAIAGGHRCKESDKDVLEHVNASNCPRSYFTPMGIPHRIPDDFDPEEERRRLKQGGCCGTPSE